MVPQICIICGPCAGGAVYSPALCDFVIQVRGTGQMYITGPKVIEQVTGEKVTSEDLGGADSHAQALGREPLRRGQRGGGVRAVQAAAELPARQLRPAAAAWWRRGRRGDAAALDAVVPDNPLAAYDMHEVVTGVVDAGDFLEVQPDFAPNLIVGFGRIEGASVGFIANNPLHRAGVLDIDSSCKGARFIRFCDAFNIPVVTFVDVPGFLPGVQQEYGGIIRHGAKMLYAYGAATVPKITVVTRKAYGGAYLAMCGKSMGADRVAVWPSGEIAVMGAEGAVEVLYRKEIEEAEDAAEARARYIREYSRDVRESLRGGGAGHGRPDHRTGADPRRTWRGRWRCCGPSARRRRRRSTGTCRSR